MNRINRHRNDNRSAYRVLEDNIALTNSWLYATATGNELQIQSLLPLASSTTPNQITIGNSSTFVNIPGTLTTVNDLAVIDKTIISNRNGPALSAGGSGFEIEEGGAVAGYVRVANDRSRIEIKAPGTSGVFRTPTSNGATGQTLHSDGTNTFWSKIVTADLDPTLLVPNSNLYASSSNLANYLVLRDGSGGFSSSSANITSLTTGAGAFPTTNGTSGQALVSNGLGSITWQTIATSPGGANGNLQYNNGGSFGGANDVNYTLGSLNVQSALTTLAGTFPNTFGTSGQVLTTDGAGTLTWQTPTGGNNYLARVPIIGAVYPGTGYAIFDTNNIDGTLPPGITVNSNDISITSGQCIISAVVFITNSVAAGYQMLLFGLNGYYTGSQVIFNNSGSTGTDYTTATCTFGAPQAVRVIVSTTSLNLDLSTIGGYVIIKPL